MKVVPVNEQTPQTGRKAARRPHCQAQEATGFHLPSWGRQQAWSGTGGLTSLASPHPGQLDSPRGQAPGVGESQGGPGRVALCGCWRGDRSTPHADTREVDSKVLVGASKPRRGEGSPIGAIFQVQQGLICSACGELSHVRKVEVGESQARPLC